MASIPEAPVSEQPPEPRDEAGTAFPRWPLWAPLAALGAGLTVTFLLLGVLVAILQAGGVKIENSSGFALASTFVLDLCVVGATVGIASMTAPPRPWQFGLRRAALAYSIGMFFIAVLSFFVFEIAYANIFNPKNPQRIVEDLGANRSDVLLVLGALTVIVVAPVCEELFFRGFLFRVLRLRTTFWIAAALDGVLFGLVHGALVILPVLVFLGVALCWVYERTGTLFATIAIHALNNTLAYGSSTDNGWVVSGALGAAMLAACVTVPRLLPKATPAPG